MANTPNHNVELPDVGADSNTWGGINNDAHNAWDECLQQDGNGTAVGIKIGPACILVATEGEMRVPASASPVLSVTGQVAVDTATNVLNVYTNGQLEVATTVQTQTLSNKTLSSPVVSGYPGLSTVQTLTAVTTSSQTRTFALTSGITAKITANQSFTLAATGTATRFATAYLFVSNNGGSPLNIEQGSGVILSESGPILVNNGNVAIVRFFWNGSQLVCDVPFNDTAGAIFPAQSPSMALPA